MAQPDPDQAFPAVHGWVDLEPSLVNGWARRLPRSCWWRQVGNLTELVAYVRPGTDPTIAWVDGYSANASQQMLGITEAGDTIIVELRAGGRLIIPAGFQRVAGADRIFITGSMPRV